MADATTHSVALFTFSVASRDEVDSVSAAALAAGGIAVAIEAVVLYNMLNVLAGRLTLQLKLLTEEFLEIVKEVRSAPAGAGETL